MGPRSVRNLTYLALIVCGVAVIYLIKQSGAKKAKQPGIENSASTLNAASDTFGMGYNSPAASTSAPDTSLLIGSASDARASAIPHTGTAKTFSGTTSAPSKTQSSDLLEVKMEKEPGSLAESSLASVHSTLTSKGVSARRHAKGPLHPKKVMHTAGDKGDFMVVAGSFASRDNAESQVNKLKKLGYKYAEAVKFDNSANTAVVVARYPYHGGAEAVVKTLKKVKIDCYVHKKDGAIFTKEVPVLVGPPKPSTNS